MFRNPLPAIFATSAFLLVLCGCQGGDDIAGVEASPIALVEATGTVNGQSIDGQVYQAGHHHGGPLRFEAHLVDHRGHSAPGHTVRLDFDVPAMGMMRRTGAITLHDDGTHGDSVPHDGFYCYEDASNEYGCHGSGAHPGEYHYEFCGLDHDGHESNRITVTAVLAE